MPHYLLSALLGLAILAFTDNAQTAAVPTRASKVATVVWGIISYTRWTDEQKSLRICLPEDSAYTAAIRESARIVNPGRQVVVRAMPLDAANACDVVYFHDIPSEETGHLLKTFIGTSVLTIGEGRAFCTAGGMFCLLADGGDEARSDGTKFAVNLDAISRSSLRIGPRVLRLSKHGRER
ncbi:MAG: YfiR family protein [Azoarcus sp.]|nr:YfiR family protein [Azoarcus sp.]